MIKYYKHKQKRNVICSVIGTTARFSKWKWKDGICQEYYTDKEVTEDFKTAFKEITLHQFNNLWGDNLAKA